MTAMTGSKLQLTDGDAVAMATALLDVNVYGKDVKDRQTCLELLIALYQVNTATPPCRVHGQETCSYHACLALSHVSMAQPSVVRSSLRYQLSGFASCSGICLSPELAGMKACASGLQVGPPVQGHGARLIEQSVDLLGWAASALDGEKDPRCLLLGFQSVQELCSLYAKHNPEVCPSRPPWDAVMFIGSSVFITEITPQRCLIKEGMLAVVLCLSQYQLSCLGYTSAR